MLFGIDEVSEGVLQTIPEGEEEDEDEDL